MDRNVRNFLWKQVFFLLSWRVEVIKNSLWNLAAFTRGNNYNYNLISKQSFFIFFKIQTKNAKYAEIYKGFTKICECIFTFSCFMQYRRFCSIFFGMFEVFGLMCTGFHPKEIEIIHRLFLFIAMYRQASSRQFNESLNLPCC